jgi:hypothetical protein
MSANKQTEGPKFSTLIKDDSTESLKISKIENEIINDYALVKR